MTLYKDVEVQLHSFSISAIDRVSAQIKSTVALLQVKSPRYPQPGSQPCHYTDYAIPSPNDVWQSMQRFLFLTAWPT
jgi:hypothetical protein